LITRALGHSGQPQHHRPEGAQSHREYAAKTSISRMLFSRQPGKDEEFREQGSAGLAQSESQLKNQRAQG